MLLCSIFVSTSLVGCTSKQNLQSKISKTSIFSWEDKYLYQEQEDLLHQTMTTLKCESVYQEIPKEISDTVIQEYLTRRHENKQDVYYLAGKSEWSLEEDGASMLQSVERVIQLNNNIDKALGFSGIVFDVEPHLLEEWDVNRKAVMKQFVNNCILAYQKAKKEKIIIILCIPNYYDRLGLSKELNRLVEFGCDALAIMNYNKKDEVGQIAEETAIVESYQKGIIHITEMQRPGVHDLTEENTYYNDGIKAVQKSWDTIKEEIKYSHLGFSWHYLKPVLQILERGNINE